eukprot:3941121-Rhodomonas_salina.8
MGYQARHVRGYICAVQYRTWHGDTTMHVDIFRARGVSLGARDENLVKRSLIRYMSVPGIAQCTRRPLCQYWASRSARVGRYHIIAAADTHIFDPLPR